MAKVEDCSPPYDYRPPAWVPNVQQTAPGYSETRARLFNETLYRSKLPGITQNQIQIELKPAVPGPGWVLNVYDTTGALAETFTTSMVDSTSPNPTPPPATICVPKVADALRTLVNAGSSLIEMPTTDHGGTVSSTPIFMSSNDPTMSPPGDDCVVAFGPTFLADGSPLGNASSLPLSPSGISTGPERTMLIVTLSEIVTGTAADNGQLVDIPNKGRQWDGTDWIPYIPNADCACS